MKNIYKSKNKVKYFLLITAIIIVVLISSVFITFGVYYNKYKLNINKLTSLNNGIKVYSYSGEDTTLYNTNRSIIEIETLPEYVVQAFVDVEDKRFYKHNGYDLKRILKASIVNIKNGSKSQGASTITQQLIKNALLNNNKTYSRKIQEIILAIKLEKKFDKNEIMEMYLNTIYFGSNAYGIENASKVYFNKSAKDLTINEACCLAGLIKSPANYSPKNNYDNCIKRKNLVASLMLENKHITQSEYNKIINEMVAVSNDNSLDHSYEEEAIFEACRLLNISERELINKNYQIVTFKDNNLQKQVIEINNNCISKSENEYNTNLDSLSIVVNNKNQVQAYYVNSNYNLHNMKRQPASLLKPFAVYVPAISHNILTSVNKILDEKINYSGFSPNNADNKFHGYVSVSEALSKSLNIPSVKILDCLGIKKAQQSLENFNIHINKEDLNLALSLGAVKNGVGIFDMVSAYSTLANMGTYRQLCFVDKILDENNNVIYSYDDYAEQVADSDSCFIVTDMLKQTATTGTASKFDSLNLPIASKTGTASNGECNTDLYNACYTTEHTMLTWIANISTNKLPNGMHSSNQPTEINKQICASLYPNGVDDFVVPKNVAKLPYDLIEYDTNNRVIKPNHDIERYTAYGYFKLDNPPKVIENSQNTMLNVIVSNNGATISFKTSKNLEYNLYKKCDNNKILLATIKENGNEFCYLDNQIFEYNNIEYYLEDNSNTCISETCKIKPKDYLINKLNNEIYSGKRKWYI